MPSHFSPDHGPNVSPQGVFLFLWGYLFVLGGRGGGGAGLELDSGQSHHSGSLASTSVLPKATLPRPPPPHPRFPLG